MTIILISAIYVSLDGGGSYFMSGSSLEEIGPGAKLSLVPLGEARALGTFSSFGPASVVHAADFGLFRTEHDSPTLTSMPVSCKPASCSARWFSNLTPFLR